MIEANRPLCVVELQARLNTYSDAYLDRFGIFTLVPIGEWKHDPDDHEWEACCATFSKEVPEEDRTQFMKDYAVDTIYVKCMEPAGWHVSLRNGGIRSTPMHFCDYHKPKVEDNY